MQLCGAGHTMAGGTRGLGTSGQRRRGKDSPCLLVPCCVLVTPPRCRLRFACPQAHFFEAGTDVFSKTLGTPAFMGGCTAWGGTFAHGCLHPWLDPVCARCLLSSTTPCLPSNDLLQRPRCGQGSSTMACRRTCGRWVSPSTPSSSGTCPSRQGAVPNRLPTCRMLGPFDALSAAKRGLAAGLTGWPCCAVQGNTLDELYTAIQTQEHEYPVSVPIRCGGRASG